MKKLCLVIFLLFLLVPVVNAKVTQLGIGGFGGLNMPIVQDDQANGSIFGFKARVKVMSFLIAEPHVMFGKWGKPDPVDGVELGIDGSKLTSFGVDALIGSMPGNSKFRPYGLVGAGIYKIKNDDTGYDESKLGFSFGTGFGIGITPLLDLDFGGKLIIAPQEEGSKKALLVTGGLLYYFNFGQ
ncbi:MAG: outer membrane beta-barrel protein [Candidatus Zixiibacteriota bacterium]